MLAGHALLKILIGFVWSTLISNYNFFLVLLPWSIVFVVMGLETIIAFLQAYIFLVLTTIYLNEAINLH
jgi:F0F1-type ATP synthase membrane subunit a